MATADPEVCAGARGPAGGPPLVGQAFFEYWAAHDCPGAFAAVLNARPVALGDVVTETCAPGPFGEVCQGSTACAASVEQGGATVTVSAPCPASGAVAYVQGYNPQALARVQGYLAGAYATFSRTNAITASPASPAYSPFQEALLGACLDPRLPGACDAWLAPFCGAIAGPAALDSATLDFCGCYVGADAFPGLPPQCAPTCHRAATVQRADPGTGAVARCAPDVCVISDVSVDLAAATVAGGLDFVNFCPACGGGCFCMISGVSVSETLAAAGAAANFAQFCGADSVCLEGTFPNLARVPCLPAAAAAAAGRARASPVPWLLLLVLAFFVAAAALAAWAARP